MVYGWGARGLAELLVGGSAALAAAAAAWVVAIVITGKELNRACIE